MEEAGLTRDLHKKISHDRRRTQQKARRQVGREEVLEVRRNNGKGILDTTPYIAVLNMITKGKYLRVGRGFVIRRRIKEIKEVQVNRLKEARREKGLSQLRLAFLTGIPPSEISRVENGWIRPYPSWRQRFARALGVTEAELFPAPEEKVKSNAD